MKERKEEQKKTDQKVAQLEEEHRKNNILIFELEERRDEGYLNTLVVMKFLKQIIQLELLDGNINYVARL